MVEEELKIRKRLGHYKGTFAQVTSFFGYQGRSGHPSHFDCSLGSTLGFTAGILIEHELTGVAVSVSNLTKKLDEWRVGGVPILELLKAQTKAG